MINYRNDSTDLPRVALVHANASFPELEKDTLSDAEPLALLALRAEWLVGILQHLAHAEGDEAGAVEVALATTLRRRLSKSGALLELLRSYDTLAVDVDHKRWARKIIARIADGDASVKPFQARAALEALCANS